MALEEQATQTEPLPEEQVVKRTKMRLWQLFSFEPEQSNAQHKEVEDGDSGEKKQTSAEVTREPKPRIGARDRILASGYKKLKSTTKQCQQRASKEHGQQQASAKKAEERTYSWYRRELSMPKKTGVEQELGDGREEKVSKAPKHNNLHTTEQKVHQKRR